MTFLAPVMLAGAAAVAVPIALHVLAKPRPRPVPWAAMALLRESVEQSRRRLRLRDGVLLLLRCLAVILLAVAMARPTCYPTRAGPRGDAVAAVFVFDLSYSMGTFDGGATRLDRAKTAATAMLDALPGGSTAHVVTFAGRASRIGPNRPSDLEQARSLVAELTLTGQTGDVAAGLSAAADALGESVGLNREVYLFTDLQKSDWDRVAGAVRATVADLRANAASVAIVRCGRPYVPVPNVTLVDVALPGGPPPTRRAGPTRVPVAVTLRNTGRVPVTDVVVSLETDGNPHDAETVAVGEVAARRTVPVTLTARLPESGAVWLTARASADGLPGDNRIDRVVVVRDRVRVLVVDGRPDPDDPRRAASHFLVNALVPLPPDRRADAVVAATIVGPGDATPSRLDDADVCFLCDAAAPGIGSGGMSKEFVERLAPFVRAGGGLVIGGGDRVTPDGYNPTFGSTGAGLLPFDLVGDSNLSPGGPFAPAPDTTESPGFLSRFREPPYGTTTAEVVLDRVTAVREGGPSGGRVLMRLTDGRPWLTAKTVGDGEVIFVGTSLDAGWSNWPAKAGSYLPFVQLALSHLTGTAARRANVASGEPIVFRAANAAARFDLLAPSPDGRRLSAAPSAVGPSGGPSTVTFTDTAHPGLYQLIPVGEVGSRRVPFAVTPDLREADDLDTLADEDLDRVFGFCPPVVEAGPDAAEALSAERGRREWAGWLIVLLVAVLVGETGWAWLAGRPA